MQIHERNQNVDDITEEDIETTLDVLSVAHEFDTSNLTNSAVGAFHLVDNNRDALAGE